MNASGGRLSYCATESRLSRRLGRPATRTRGAARQFEDQRHEAASAIVGPVRKALVKCLIDRVGVEGGFAVVGKTAIVGAMCAPAAIDLQVRRVIRRASRAEKRTFDPYGSFALV